MSREEQALVDASPTFADLCWQVRAARMAHRRAIDATDRARAALRAAEDAQKLALNAEDEARDKLDSFIDRECEVDN